jgi:hypothetical protein
MSGRARLHGERPGWRSPWRRDRAYWPAEKSESKVNENLNVTVGQPVPTVELHQLPPDALGEMPIARPYRYTVLAGQVVLVDPATMRVVDIIKP